MNKTKNKKDYNKGTRIARAVLVALVVLSFALLYRRAVTYRKVIYDYQALTEARSRDEQEALRQDIERKVGRANTPWYNLDKAPRYLHFWDDYNVWSNTQLNNLLYDME